ncbi:TcaA NTF2-like domain-containing protein [Fontibacillus sp. BL9]|uniref:TcaA NTF2-like domain-containing protein n=1 Tax=Fontibacillus sp. BL9 TaxID=3389971 RepID=UPI00397C57D1
MRVKKLLLVCLLLILTITLSSCESESAERTLTLEPTTQPIIEQDFDDGSLDLSEAENDNNISLGAAPADSYFSEMILRAYEESVYDAKNNKDFSMVEKYLIKDSEFFREMKSFISEQSSEEVIYTLISYDIEDMVQHDNSSEEYDLYVKETIALYDEKQSEGIEKTDYWIYTIISNENHVEGISNRAVWEKNQ